MFWGEISEKNQESKGEAKLFLFIAINKCNYCTTYFLYYLNFIQIFKILFSLPFDFVRGRINIWMACYVFIYIIFFT